ncbi:MAG: ATP-binding protein [Chloroflexi bacterium AL-W]|nr:ATP-binding protein [Chloroflexi bacterium AL-N1]NOK67266.1 ATP-binding protein [Chloroflexi bacterium AL-N10]NOK75240.1 ATP-binding protein [Chloroflexi bacterium AL-N5]NOK82028.1 ATP-binding protein [Chloroflexi bacterium AL-W]NOK89873.1 ATP-binding protein [Chloroflexi bacterium AL-N15]
MVELCFPSTLGCEKIGLDAITTFACRFGFSDEQIANFKTVLGDACVNVIEHGNQCQTELQVQVHYMCDEQRLSVYIHDQGLKKCQVSGPLVPIEHKLRGCTSLRDMGLSIIGQLVDEVGFVELIENGNRFRFIIYQHPKHLSS